MQQPEKNRILSRVDQSLSRARCSQRFELGLGLGHGIEIKPWGFVCADDSYQTIV